VETFTYDPAGNKTGHTDFNGHVTTYSYDSMNRPITKTPDVSFGAPAVTFTYTQTGQRASMNDSLGASTYTYDQRDRLLAKATPIGNLTYTYTGTGRLASIRSSNAGGATVDYAYDVINRLSTVTDNNLPGASTYSYDNVGNLTGEANPNGVTTTYTYDTLNRLTNDTIAKGGTLASYAYTMGAAGNRIAVSELGGRSVNYAYDGIYRLTSETIAGAAANNGTISYAYDAVGNRLTRTSTSAGVPASASTYDVDDRLTSDAYDQNGNTTASGANTYTYDFEDHIKTATGGVSYVYDGDGRRVRKITGAGTTNYLIDDRNPSGLPQVLEEISGGVVQRVYVCGLTRISERQGGVTSFYGYDGRGSVRLLTNATGAVTDTYNYDAFGIKLDSAGTTPNDFLFSGEQFDSNLQFYYMRARYANQASGRFLTMDPLPGTTTDPRSLHRYLYAANDPVNKTDPTGNQFDLVSISISISIDTSIQQIYTTQLVHTFFDVQQLAYCCLQPALVLKDVALELIIDDGPDWAWDLYEGASDAEAKAYQMIAMRIAQTYRNILHDIAHAEFTLTIPLVDYKLEKQIDLADISGLPDYSGRLKEVQSQLDSFFGDWKGLLDNADSAGNCELATFINKWGTKLADKVLGKLFSSN
jgi:RHS repeat-associated protein